MEKKFRWKLLQAKKSLICGLHFEASCFKAAKKGRLDFNNAVIIDYLFNNNNPRFPFTAALLLELPLHLPKKLFLDLPLDPSLELSLDPTLELPLDPSLELPLDPLELPLNLP